MYDFGIPWFIISQACVGIIWYSLDVQNFLKLNPIFYVSYVSFGFFWLKAVFSGNRHKALFSE